ncbi:MAG TPA: DUF4349 domain-containing protein [Symbiobacteriaceae bacterium]|nr:DUF4349 domain-containing protein [Symbiobacteriaceae bacterium]
MAEPKRALTDLRSTAQAELFADWRVTPELKAKLRQRIEAEAADAPTAAVATGGKAPASGRKAPGPWVRWGATAGVAVAAMAAFVMIGLQPSTQNDMALDTKAPDGQGAYAAPQSPAERPATGAPAPSAVKAPLVGSATSMNVTVTDAYANVVSAPTVTYTSQIVEGKALNGTTTFADADLSVNTGAAPTVPATESQPGRKIILNAEYSLEVKDAVTAMQRLQTLAATTAGYMVDASLKKGQDGSWAGRLTLRLPASLYNGAITEIRTIGDVKQERQWSQDVTERYYDLEARIRIQQEYEQKLQELAAKAATFDDWMKLTRQINDTRALIEQMQGSIKLLANQVEYSTINISFFQPAPDQLPPPKPPEPAKGLWPAMARSFGRSVQWFAELGQALLVGVAAFAPFLVALVILGLTALAVWRRLRLQKTSNTN